MLLHYLFFFFKNGPFPASFSFFVFWIQWTVNVQYNFFDMTRFELRTSGIRRNCPINWATTTARFAALFVTLFQSLTLARNIYPMENEFVNFSKLANSLLSRLNIQLEKMQIPTQVLLCKTRRLLCSFADREEKLLPCLDFFLTSYFA